jgi:cell division protein FtsN
MTSEQEMTCPNCGGQTRYTPGSTVVKCLSCGSDLPISTSAVTPDDDPPRIVPITFDDRALRRAAHEFMSRGKLAPADLVESAVITTCEVLYLPAYFYVGSYEANWTASFGYDRKEEYTVYEEQFDSSLGTRVRRPVTKTRTVTDWRPMNGREAGSFKLTGYAGTEQPAQVRKLLSEMEWSDSKDFDAAFLQGIRCENRVRTSDQIYSEFVRQDLNALIARDVKNNKQGDQQKDWHWKADVTKTSTSYLLPLGWVRFVYKDKEYNFWVDGTDIGKTIGDKLPIDSMTLISSALSHLPTAAAAGSWLAMPDGASTTAAGVAAIGLGVFGAARHKAIWDRQKQMREHSLMRRVSAEGGADSLDEGQRQSLSSAYADLPVSQLGRTDKDTVRIPVLVLAALLVSWSPSILGKLTVSRAVDEPVKTTASTIPTPEALAATGPVAIESAPQESPDMVTANSYAAEAGASAVAAEAAAKATAAIVRNYPSYADASIGAQLAEEARAEADKAKAAAAAAKEAAAVGYVEGAMKASSDASTAAAGALSKQELAATFPTDSADLAKKAADLAAAAAGAPVPAVATSLTEPGFFVQAGSFSSQEAATGSVALITSLGFSGATVVDMGADGLKVRFGPFPSKADALDLVRRLRLSGQQAFVVGAVEACAATGENRFKSPFGDSCRGVWNIYASISVASEGVNDEVAGEDGIPASVARQAEQVRFTLARCGITAYVSRSNAFDQFTQNLVIVHSEPYSDNDSAAGEVKRAMDCGLRGYSKISAYDAL